MEAALHAIAQTSRTEAAHRKFAQTVDRLRILEQQVGSAFEELVTDAETLREVGVRSEVDLSPPLAAALSVWKNERSEERVARRVSEA